MSVPTPGEACAWWVLEQLRHGALTATQMIARASGVWYEANHKTHWRRVDRAIQRLRKERLIRCEARLWRLTPAGLAKIQANSERARAARG